MTEAEAKTKWCPMARVPFVDGQEDRDGYPVTLAVASVNRKRGNNGPEENVNCLASGCMMWRWSTKHPQEVHPRRWIKKDEAIPTGFEETGANHPIVISAGVLSDAREIRCIETRHDGYCGLAGFPSYGKHGS